ncbi:MAG TPA: DUF3501 family protein [Nitrospiria bacterium]|jgi:hypothetical protein|nr:DUF3501 family protein [Nitrospiria bacterium]
MNTLELKDIKPLPEYEAVRKPFRDRIIALKKRRRVPLGERITLVFENRDTVLFQIQEMMRVEHIYDPAKIQDELDTYNPLIAGPGELSATLFIEITEPERIKETLDQLRGIDNGRCLFFEIGADRIDGRFEEGHSNEEKLSAVHYVRFRFTPEQRAAFRNDQVPAALTADHPHYRVRTPLGKDVRHELSEDFL